METNQCPKCNTLMDEGYVSWSNGNAGYMSNKQTGTFRIATKISAARACPNCGYVEMYVNPQELKQRIPNA